MAPSLSRVLIRQGAVSSFKDKEDLSIHFSRGQVGAWNRCEVENILKAPF